MRTTPAFTITRCSDGSDDKLASAIRHCCFVLSSCEVTSFMNAGSAPLDKIGSRQDS
jgi:hypothetical protein